MKYIKWFKEISENDLLLVGEKAYNISQLYNLKFTTPSGFVITSEAHREFLLRTGVQRQIDKALDNLESDKEDGTKIFEKIKEIILKTNIPEEIEQEIIKSYHNMNIDPALVSIPKETFQFIKVGRDIPYVAVRISMDNLNSNDIFLNIKGGPDLINAIKNSWASIYSQSVKKDNSSSEELVAPLIIQRMINSDRSAICSSNGEEVIIKAAYGLASSLTSIPANLYRVDKNNFRIKGKTINRQEFIFTISELTNKIIKKDVLEEKSRNLVLNEEEIKKLAYLTKKIENYYKEPQEIEFAIENGIVYVIQTKPIKDSIESTKIEKTDGEELFLYRIRIKNIKNNGEKQLEYVMKSEKDAIERCKEENQEEWVIGEITRVYEVDGRKILLKKK